MEKKYVKDLIATTTGSIGGTMEAIEPSAIHLLTLVSGNFCRLLIAFTNVKTQIRPENMPGQIWIQTIDTDDTVFPK